MLLYRATSPKPRLRDTLRRIVMTERDRKNEGRSPAATPAEERAVVRGPRPRKLVKPVTGLPQEVVELYQSESSW
jgi:hypothetical protein